MKKDLKDFVFRGEKESSLGIIGFILMIIFLFYPSYIGFYFLASNLGISSLSIGLFILILFANGFIFLSSRKKLEAENNE